jgi:hypothetical protein
MIWRFLLVFGLMLSIATPAPASNLEIDSKSLGAMILGKKVKLMMRDASYLEGKVVRAGPKEILIHVKKSEIQGSAIKIHNSQVLLRTSDIGAVYLSKSGSVAAPVALGVIGGILGVAGSVFALEDTRNATAAWITLTVITAGGATGGALLGREVVRKTVTVNVISGDH